MAYDEGLAHRIREVLVETPDLQEKQMFGGVSFMIRGNMACGVIGEDMIVRVNPEKYDEWLTTPGARPFDFTGRVMKGWLTIGPAGHENDEDLRTWIQRGLDFALSLPAK